METTAESPYFLDATFTPSDGLARCGMPFVCTARLLKDGQPALGTILRCTVKWETEVVSVRDVVFDGSPVVVSYASDKPGWLYICFQIVDANGDIVQNPGHQIVQKRKQAALLYEVGALFDADRIIAKPSRPADFDAFWAGEKARLAALPMVAKLTPCAPPEGFASKVELFSLEVNCLGRYPVTGYLAVPVGAKPKSLPACVEFLSHVWADASAVTACTTASEANAVTAYISWHGQPTGLPEKWYEEHQDDYYHPLEDIDKPTKWYFHDMYLRVLRALAYMKTRPEWNGKDLVIRGGSLAGIQAITGAALDPDVTLALINAPTGCELNGPDCGRAPGWVFRKERAGNPLLHKPDVIQNNAYHDGVNLASLFHCETYLSIGLVDEVCFPSCVVAFFNALPDNIEKFLTTNPLTGHYGTTANPAAKARVAKGLNSVTISSNKE